MAGRDGRLRVDVDPRGRFAYVAGDVLVRGEEAARRLVELAKSSREPVTPRGRELAGLPSWRRFTGVPDPLGVIAALRNEGHLAQPNHVLSTDGCGSACAPHPAYGFAAIANPMSANPMSANPMSANPMSANPMSANPMSANPMSANPMSANRAPTSSAVPMPGPVLPRRVPAAPAAGRPVVVILDSGLADPRPDLLQDRARVTGTADVPSADGDDWLDPVAGHGTFIAGLVEQLAPGCRVHVSKVVNPHGLVPEVRVAQELARIVDEPDEDVGRPEIIGLSLGGPALEAPFLLRTATLHARANGVVVVASAGNVGTCAPQYPAAFDEVVAVAALGPNGPAPWSNYGDWVDACAPGVDQVSAFFDAFDGDVPSINEVDLDRFDDWARWSGTSFAVPVVIAALAREMRSFALRTVDPDTGGTKDEPVTAEDAVQHVVRAPHLLRIPCFGTVVNI